MKKEWFLLCMTLLCTAGCTESLEEKTPQILVPLSFSTDLQKEIVDFNRTRAVSGDLDPGVLPEQAETHTDLAYFVFPETGEKALKYHQYKHSDEDFGIVYDTLAVGTYRIAFLAHSSPKMTFTQSGQAYFSKVSDSFYALQTITVSSGKESRHDVTLDRIAGRIEFKATDEVPANIKQFDVEINNYSTGINILTGKGIVSSETYTLSYPFLEEDKGKANTSFAFYTFIPGTEQTTNVTIKAIKNDESVNRTQTLEITPVVNKTIRYTGKLYTFTEANDHFNIAVDSQWEAPEENILPDN